MAASELKIEIKTVADLRAAKAVEQSLQQQIIAAKAAGRGYAELKTQLDAVQGGLRSKGFFGRATSEMMGFAEQIPVVGSLMRSFNGGAGLASAALAGLAGAATLARSALSAFSRIEDIETSFVTLLGSVAAAKDRLAELSKFAAATPFNLPEIAQASKVLQNLTDGALATGDGLRMVGDVAAATNAPFAEVAVTLGRLYQGLRDGTPVGEAAARMTELTGINMRQAKSWDEIATALGKYNGEMSRRSATISGKESTLADTMGMLMTALGKPIAPAYKDFLEKMIAGVEKATGWIEKFGAALERHNGIVNAAVSAVGTLGAALAVRVVGGGMIAGIQALTAMIFKNKSAIDAETSSISASTAALSANAAARKAAASVAFSPTMAGAAGMPMSRAASAATGSTMGTSAAYLKADYDRYRAMGKTPQEAVAAARELKGLQTAVAGASKSVGGFGAALSGAMGGLRGMLNSTMGVFLAAPVAADAVSKFFNEGVPNMLAGLSLGGKTSASDMKEAEGIRAQSAREQEEFARRIGEMQTFEDRDSLLKDMLAAAKTSQDSQKEVGFFGEGRTARNTALADHGTSLARLMDILSRSQEGLISLEEAKEETRRSSNSAENLKIYDAYDRSRHDESRAERVSQLEQDAVDAADPQRLEAHIREYRQILNDLSQSLDAEDMTPEDYSAQIDSIEEYRGYIERLEEAKTKASEASAKKQEAELKEETAAREAALLKEAELERARSETELKRRQLLQASEEQLAIEREKALKRELAISQQIADLRGEGAHHSALAQEALAQAALDVSAARRADRADRAAKKEEQSSRRSKFDALDDTEKNRIRKEMAEAYGPGLLEKEDNTPFGPEDFMAGDAPDSIRGREARDRDTAANPPPPLGAPTAPPPPLPGAPPAPGQSPTDSAASGAGDRAAEAASQMGASLAASLEAVAAALQAAEQSTSAAAKNADGTASAVSSAAGALAASLANLRARVAALEAAAG